MVIISVTSKYFRCFRKRPHAHVSRLLVEEKMARNGPESTAG